jgi:hypothetical protein
LHLIPSILILPHYYGSSVDVTNQRIISVGGFLITNIDEIYYDRISAVSSSTNSINYIIGCGTVTVRIPSTFGRKSFGAINKPRQLRQAISEQIVVYKREETNMQAEIITSKLLD